MSNLPRQELIALFDVKAEKTFAQNNQTDIHRYFEASVNHGEGGGTAMVEKRYTGTFSKLQRRENELLFALAQHQVNGVEISSRVATMMAYRKQGSALAGHQINVKWYGFDLDDWGKLLSDRNPMHQSRWLLELARSAIKALQLLHGAGYVHCDIHNGNWCLPFTAVVATPDGRTLTGSLQPDALKLIDLGLSLRPSAERGPPPRFQNADGSDGAVIQFDTNMQPVPAPRLVQALAHAQAGNLALWQNLDWRIDLWRLGALLDHWMLSANNANGLTGPNSQRMLLRELVTHLQRPETELSLNGPVSAPAQPHGQLVDWIQAEIGDPKACPFALQLNTQESTQLLALRPQAKPAPVPVPIPVPVPPNDVAYTDPLRTAMMVGGAVMTVVLLIGIAFNLLGRFPQFLQHFPLVSKFLPQTESTGGIPGTVTPAEIEATKAIRLTARDVVADAAKDAAGTSATLRVSLDTYPGGPRLIQLPKATASGPGTLLGDAQGGLSEQPPYQVRVPYTLYMGESEVTFAQWDQCVAAGGCEKATSHGADLAKHPVTGVSWNMVQNYLHWLNQQAKVGEYAPDRYRLPTEAEWEYAARAGSNGEFSLGPSNSSAITPALANYDSTHQYKGSPTGLMRGKTVAATSLPPNAWGLHEMHGNVQEWVQDCYSSDEYTQREKAKTWLASQTNERDAASCDRVLRGGSWGGDPRNLRAAGRNQNAPGFSFSFTGFRLARTLP